MQTKQFFKISGFIGFILLISLGIIAYFFQPPWGLDYEAVQTFRVGSFSAALETQTYTIAQGDNGAAQIIVSAGG